MQWSQEPVQQNKGINLQNVKQQQHFSKRKNTGDKRQHELQNNSTQLIVHSLVEPQLWNIQSVSLVWIHNLDVKYLSKTSIPGHSKSSRSTYQYLFSYVSLLFQVDRKQMTGPAFYTHLILCLAIYISLTSIHCMVKRFRRCGVYRVKPLQNHMHTYPHHLVKRLSYANEMRF